MLRRYDRPDSDLAFVYNNIEKIIQGSKTPKAPQDLLSLSAENVTILKRFKQ